MQKPIPRPLHGVADYGYAALVAAAPELFGFADEKAAATLCRTLSAGTLLYTLCTRAEWGVVRRIPFKAHLATDFLSGVFCLGAPWLFGFAHNERARNTFLDMGLTSIVVPSLTQPAEMNEIEETLRT